LFLTKRVKAPDQDDYKKLRCTMQNLRGSIDLLLTLEADDVRIIKWWVDASYAVHPDMKSHTGGTMSMGKGSIYSASKTQRLNTKSSTEAELVGVDDVSAQILWTRYFSGRARIQGPRQHIPRQSKCHVTKKQWRRLK
jgi:hypothetical protein